MTTLDRLADRFREAIEEEIESIGIAEWSINAAGFNILGLDHLGGLSATDLEEVINEIQEGYSLKLEVDLSDLIVAELEALLESRELEEDEYDDEYYLNEED